MKNYFGNNPIARQIALETFKLNENASVDSLLEEERLRLLLILSKS
jgi:hypothetical protein